METIEIFYTVRYTDNDDTAEKCVVVGAANADIYQADFAKSVAEGREFDEYRTGRKQVVVAFRIVRPSEVAKTKNPTSNKGIL